MSAIDGKRSESLTDEERNAAQQRQRAKFGITPDDPFLFLEPTFRIDRDVWNASFIYTWWSLVESIEVLQVGNIPDWISVKMVDELKALTGDIVSIVRRTQKSGSRVKKFESASQHATASDAILVTIRVVLYDEIMIRDQTNRTGDMMMETFETLFENSLECVRDGRVKVDVGMLDANPLRG